MKKTYKFKYNVNDNAPIDPGEYLATLSIKNPLALAASGLLQAANSNMIYDGKWCEFFKDGKKVFSCNVRFAARHFDLKKID